MSTLDEPGPSAPAGIGTREPAHAASPPDSERARAAAETLDDLRALVHTDPRRVATGAHAVASAARAAGDQALLSRSLATLGRARRSLGEIDLAEHDLLEAVAAAGRVADDDLIADAHLALAGVLSFSGRSGEAAQHLEIVERRGSQRLRTLATLQRAAVDQRAGRRREALASYDAALPQLRRLDSRIDVALVLLNSGLIRTETGQGRRALDDLTAARTMFEQEQHTFGVAQSWHNLGCAYASLGDLPAAMHHLDMAAERFADLGHAAPELDVDRIETLLAAGLVRDAAELSRTVAAALEASGDRSHQAIVWLLRAKAALLADDPIDGRAWAARAADLFAAQGARPWELVAQLYGHLAREDGDPDELVALGRDLDAVMNLRAAATAFGLASVAASRIGDTERARVLAQACAARAAGLGVLEVTLLAAHARAVVEARLGSPERALRHARDGLHELQRHRETLVAGDAHAAIATHARHLVATGQRVAHGTGSAATVLEWMERARAGSGRFVPPRPPADEEVASGLSRLRALNDELRACESAGVDPQPLLLDIQQCEQAIRRRLLSRSADTRAAASDPAADDTSQPPSIGRVQARLGTATLVSMSVIDGRLVAVRVGQDGARCLDVWSQDHAGDVSEAISASLRAANTPGRPAAARALAVAALRRGLSTLDAVIRPLVEGDGPVILVVPASLHIIPWRLLPCLTGRPVSVAPSVSWWVAARDRAGSSPHEGRPGSSPPDDIAAPPAVAVAGPRLVQAQSEAAAVARQYGDGRVLVGDAATVGAVSAALETAGVVHIACHGHTRSDNPLWSSLELADGPLFAYDLQRLRRLPPLVVLSGCATGAGTSTGDRLLGLSAVLLEGGSTAVVASLCLLADTPMTRDVMTSVHAHVADGLAAASALAAVPYEGDDERYAVSAALACLGGL